MLLSRLFALRVGREGSPRIGAAKAAEDLEDPCGS